MGSSARKKSGSLASCLAMTILCFSPPDRSLAMCMVLCAMLTNSRRLMAFSTRFGVRSSMASRTFSMTDLSPKRAKVLCSMMAILPRISSLRGSCSGSDQ